MPPGSWTTEYESTAAAVPTPPGLGPRAARRRVPARGLFLWRAPGTLRDADVAVGAGADRDRDDRGLTRHEPPGLRPMTD